MIILCTLCGGPLAELDGEPGATSAQAGILSRTLSGVLGQTISRARIGELLSPENLADTFNARHPGGRCPARE